MKLHLEVIPNPFNESGYVIVIYKKVFGLSFEIGRVLDTLGLDRFMEAYRVFNGREYKL